MARVRDLLSVVLGWLASPNEPTGGAPGKSYLFVVLRDEVITGQYKIDNRETFVDVRT